MIVFILIDLYLESKLRKIRIEVKDLTLSTGEGLKKNRVLFDRSVSILFDGGYPDVAYWREDKFSMWVKRTWEKRMDLIIRGLLRINFSPFLIGTIIYSCIRWIVICIFSKIIREERYCSTQKNKTTEKWLWFTDKRRRIKRGKLQIKEHHRRLDMTITLQLEKNRLILKLYPDRSRSFDQQLL